MIIRSVFIGKLTAFWCSYQRRRSSCSCQLDVGGGEYGASKREISAERSGLGFSTSSRVNLPQRLSATGTSYRLYLPRSDSDLGERHINSLHQHQYSIIWSSANQIPESMLFGRSFITASIMHENGLVLRSMQHWSNIGVIGYAYRF